MCALIFFCAALFVSIVRAQNTTIPFDQAFDPASGQSGVGSAVWSTVDSLSVGAMLQFSLTADAPGDTTLAAVNITYAGVTYWGSFITEAVTFSACPVTTAGVQTMTFSWNITSFYRPQLVVHLVPNAVLSTLDQFSTQSVCNWITFAGYVFMVPTSAFGSSALLSEYAVLFNVTDPIYTGATIVAWTLPGGVCDPGAWANLNTNGNRPNYKTGIYNCTGCDNAKSSTGNTPNYLTLSLPDPAGADYYFVHVGVAGASTCIGGGKNATFQAAPVLAPSTSSVTSGATKLDACIPATVGCVLAISPLIMVAVGDLYASNIEASVLGRSLIFIGCIFAWVCMTKISITAMLEIPYSS